MKATRQTQPHRRSMGRAPSPVLDKMLAGRATPGAGAHLARAMAQVPRKRPKLYVPRY